MSSIEHPLARQVARAEGYGDQVLTCSLLGGWLDLAPPFIHALGKVPWRFATRTNGCLCRDTGLYAKKNRTHGYEDAYGTLGALY
ncbi:unnamed protein product [Lasius platythorax]|uniref:Uncharacterized protein n=1 Tax=Lasius platythorax TaxID=488582 RepID=A0AAV2NIS1_9HYME